MFFSSSCLLLTCSVCVWYLVFHIQHAAIHTTRYCISPQMFSHPPDDVVFVSTSKLPDTTHATVFSAENTEIVHSQEQRSFPSRATVKRSKKQRPFGLCDD
ncbi:hypothetical protein B0H65DRAFT_450570 [Neurospora tetraspora]|uniref:Secreted protein n=1 Tax=Neurospora tetraspora TaxID=94610 RepID=A0AAE0MWP7_9PEZI|nr:hypothetical protein B0H65DRAFT_450570 [Neurospora tetraspora]